MNDLREVLRSIQDGQKLLAVREFATDLIQYEREHAAGPETPMVLAIARDLLAILDGDA